MCLNVDRVFLAAIDFARIFKIPQDFLLLGIHRDSWLLVSLEGSDSLRNELELRISIRMLLAFNGLAVGLKAIPSIFEKLADLDTADLKTLPLQFNCKASCDY